MRCRAEFGIYSSISYSLAISFNNACQSQVHACFRVVLLSFSFNYGWNWRHLKPGLILQWSWSPWRKSCFIASFSSKWRTNELLGLYIGNVSWITCVSYGGNGENSTVNKYAVFWGNCFSLTANLQDEDGKVPPHYPRALSLRFVCTRSVKFQQRGSGSVSWKQG